MYGQVLMLYIQVVYVPVEIPVIKKKKNSNGADEMVIFKCINFCTSKKKKKKNGVGSIRNTKHILRSGCSTLSGDLLIFIDR